jgi:hypothetical protein
LSNIRFEVTSVLTQKGITDIERQDNTIVIPYEVSRSSQFFEGQKIMVEARILQFVSKQYRSEEHGACNRSWEGFKIICDCICHSNKNRMLAQVEGPRTSIVIESSHINQNGGQHD